MPHSDLHLAFQADENYVDGFVATLASAAARLPRATRVDVFFIDCGLLPETRARLAALFSARFPRFTLRFLSLDADVLARLPLPAGLSHVNRSTYGRLFLPDLLPDIDRLIYLDCDLLIDADLTVLDRQPLEGALVAAARDAEANSSRSADAPSDFNAGVMIMDLKALRAADLTRRAVALAAYGDTRHGDQTLLNTLLRDRWTPLDPRWNRQVFLLPTFSIFRSEPDSIWHIYMGRKPWHFHRAGARGLVAEYYAWLDRVGWTPVSPPTHHLHPSLGRDLLKAAAAPLRRASRLLR